MCFYQCIFNNNIYINSILFNFFAIKYLPVLIVKKSENLKYILI